MNATVWIMVMYAYGNTINIGPEFSTQDKCERAAVAVAQSSGNQALVGTIRRPWCVRIEK